MSNIENFPDILGELILEPSEAYIKYCEIFFYILRESITFILFLGIILKPGMRYIRGHTTVRLNFKEQLRIRFILIFRLGYEIRDIWIQI